MEADLTERVNAYLASVSGSFRRSFRRLDDEVGTRVDEFGAGARLWMEVLGHGLVYVIQTSPTGSTGALTARVTARHFGEDTSEELLDLAPTDSVTIAPGETVEQRWPDVEELIDRTLAVAVDRFARKLN